MARVSLVLVVLLLICVHASFGATMKEEEGEFNYKDALDKAILFFEGQRSGKLPNDQRASWRSNSALSDGNLENVDLEGGYYDAGDNVKFLWPMAFTGTLLSWTAVEYAGSVSSSGQLGHLHTAIRWAADFTLKAYNSRDTTLYTQVGDGNSDHNCWERPEDMDTPRTLYKITSFSPGTEVAAEAAAFLTSASIVFRHIDFGYSVELLNTSKSLFEFANKNRGTYRGSCPFYCSFSGFEDELLWASAWLFKATNDTQYLDFVLSNKGWSNEAHEFSWDNKSPGVQLLLTMEFLSGRKELEKYKRNLDSFVCSLMPNSGNTKIHTTPGGLLYTRDSSNLQYVSSASFVLLLYSKTLNATYIDGINCGSVKISNSQMTSFAKSQIDYILGKNPLRMSYMTGFGGKYPLQVHHRGASIPSIQARPEKVGCTDGYTTWFSTQNPNPNTHVGAIVGGPDSKDQFNDDRSDPTHLEPTTYSNAAIVGALVALLDETQVDAIRSPLNNSYRLETMISVANA